MDETRGGESLATLREDDDDDGRRGLPPFHLVVPSLAADDVRRGACVRLSCHYPLKGEGESVCVREEDRDRETSADTACEREDEACV